MNDIPTPTAEEHVEEAFRAACSDVIVTARRLKSRLAVGDLNAAAEFGRLAGARMTEAGVTHEEGTHYMGRILDMVLAEQQA